MGPKGSQLGDPTLPPALSWDMSGAERREHRESKSNRGLFKFFYLRFSCGLEACQMVSPTFQQELSGTAMLTWIPIKYTHGYREGCVPAPILLGYSRHKTSTPQPFEAWRKLGCSRHPRVPRCTPHPAAESPKMVQHLLTSPHLDP